MHLRSLAFASILLLEASHGVRAAGFDHDPFLYDPSFAGNGIYIDGIAGANGTCLELTCYGKAVASLSGGDSVTAAELYSWHDDGVGGGFQNDGDFALIRHNAAGVRVAWSNPSAAYAHYNSQYIVWPNNDTSAGRMVSRLVDMKVVDGYIYVLFEYADTSDSGAWNTRTGLTVFRENGQWVQTKYRLLCQIGECSDTAVGLSVLPGFNEAKRLLAVGSTAIQGNLQDRGIKVKGMVLDAATGYAWDDSNFGDAGSRTFFQVPDSQCRPDMRPCQFSLARLAAATDSVDYNYTYTYLVGSVKWNNASSDPSGADNNVLVVKLREDGYPAANFGSGGFQAVAFNADGRWNDLGAAITAENRTQQSGDVAGGVYVAANVGIASIGIARLAPESGAVDTTFGNGGLAIAGGRHCTLPAPQTCLFVNFPADSAYDMIKDGDRLVVAGSHSTTMSIGGTSYTTTSPLLAVARAGDGTFTELHAQPIPSEEGRFAAVSALGGGRYLVAGSTLSDGAEPLAVTARLRADRIFASGMEP